MREGDEKGGEGIQSWGRERWREIRDRREVGKEPEVQEGRDI